jgi:uncharacterized protein YlxW (UPF0749 family)
VRYFCSLHCIAWKEKKELISVNNKLLADEKSTKEKLEALDKQLQELNAAHTTQSSEKAALEAEVEKLKVDTKDGEVTKHQMFGDGLLISTSHHEQHVTSTIT